MKGRTSMWVAAVAAASLTAGCRNARESAPEAESVAPASATQLSPTRAKPTQADQKSPADLDQPLSARGLTFEAQAEKGPAPGAPPMIATRAVPPVTSEVPLDPNGRFATTYRPGGGHLAAFESAVARGIIPEAERELVADIGARYWPSMPEPTTKALGMQLDFERTKLAPSGGPLHLRIALRSTSKAPGERPHLSVHLVLDTSGSMSGEPITQARAAARHLVSRLAATDDFSLTTFSSSAEVAVTDGPVGVRRAVIAKAIDAIDASGGTNISEGLRLAYEQASNPSIPRDAVRVVLLLSDGRANAGITDPQRLSMLALDAFQQGTQTSTFGLGVDYDGTLMSAIAADGAGGYYYLRDAEQMAPALSTELDKRLDPAATAVEVRVRLRPDVQLLRAYGSRRLNQEESARVRVQEVAADKQSAQRDNIAEDRQEDADGGMRFFIPAFSRDDTHAMLLKLQMPPGVGRRAVSLIEIKYKDRVHKRNVAEEVRVAIDYANSDAESASSLKPSVARTIQGFSAGEALMQAARLVSQGDRQAALALLTEREQILRQASQTLAEPLFLRGADRMARLRSHMSGYDGLGEPLVLSMLLETAARSHLR